MNRPFCIALITVLALQFYSRYAAAPVVDFTVDDWSLLSRARECPSYAAAAALVTQDPDRPFGAAMLTLLFKAFDDRPWCWPLFSIGAYSTLMALLVLLAKRLDGRPVFALILGLVFALAPNLTESFLWPTMVGYAAGLIAYVAAALCWVSYLQNGGAVGSIMAGFFLAFGLGTYEVGLGLPFAFLMLMDPGRWRRQFAGWLPCMLATLAYLAWKFTHGFGMAHGVLFAPRTPDLSPSVLAWNAKEAVSWWFGFKMFSCVSAGWASFATMDKWPWRFFFAGNFLVVLLLASGLGYFRNGDSSERGRTFSGRQIVLFGLVWALVTAGISVFSWAGGRLNFMPAIGIAIVIAWLLSDRQPATWLPSFALMALVCLPVNEGTAIAWRDSGTFHRHLFDYLSVHQKEWRKAEAVLFDTAKLRQRLTPGLVTAPESNPRAWAYNGNAGLLRGFAPESMMRMAAGEKDIPIAILDMECDALRDGRELTWHDRWNPSKPHRLDIDRVYVVDCFDAGMKP